MKQEKDYKKLYEEAIERAEKSLRAANDIGKDVVEFIFPQLAESEDERIRKVIKLALIASEEELSAFYSTHNITRKECTDWLERQKEQKPCEDSGTDGDIMQYIEEGEKRGIKEVISFPEKYGLQKEQKPMERSKEYADCISLIIKYFEGKSENEDTNFADKKVFKRWARVLDEDSKINSVTIDGKPVPTKEQSVDISAGVPWSKEDESILNNIIAYKYLNVDDLEWIKNLPKRFGLQPKQEWSEGVKNRLFKIAEYLKYKGYEDDAEFIESLHPQPKVDSVEYERGFLAGQGSIQHWKPTDEQYYALRDAIIKLDADDSDARFPWEGLPTLHSLANDLFELRKK